MNNEHMINLADTFEHALNNLHTVSPIERSVIAANIAELDYLVLLISQPGSRPVYENLVKQIAGQIDTKTAIVDIMSISALYYKGKKAGFDVDVLYQSINNNGDWLMSEQLKSMSKNIL